MYNVSDFRFRDLVTSTPDESVREAAAKMVSKHVGCVLVTSKTDIVGIATRYDFVNSIVENRDPNRTRVRTIMHASPITIDASSTLTLALKTMIEKRVERVVVRSGTKILGVLSLEDVVSSLEVETMSSLNREKYDQIFDMVRRLTPNLISRFQGEEKEWMLKEMRDERFALLRLLEEAEISLGARN